MEFNTTVPYRHELWEEVATVAPNVIIGLDVHNRKVLKSTEDHDNAIATLSQLGITPIETLL